MKISSANSRTQPRLPRKNGRGSLKQPIFWIYECNGCVSNLSLTARQKRAKESSGEKYLRKMSFIPMDEGLWRPGGWWSRAKIKDSKAILCHSMSRSADTFDTDAVQRIFSGVISEYACLGGNIEPI